ncbi:cation diffusion facilitator family transporter [Actinoplanes rectilineatus]|uniref:cation diffusion facilitator family transporter n=1 Tax=Actinoplanes rectilineatus TaxID=113571 RepID=UPI000AD7D0D1|nr:cation diffusion facilitator family transporter [Actinoplanes rectilineatus]
MDDALASSRAGMRALWISLAGLGLTAALQGAVAAISGSVALVSDTVHNVAGALTAIPLGIAIRLGRRAATRAYTYGFGRAEDLAGVGIVAVIAVSAAATAWLAIGRLIDPHTVTHLPWVLAAGVVGFAGNEVVARYRITVGRRIGSAALIADGVHARTGGFASLAVVLAASGSALGWRLADPVVALGVTAAIVWVLKDGARAIYHRLMDRVDPSLVDDAEDALRSVPGVADVDWLRLRWIGHRLYAEAAIAVDDRLSLLAAHEIATDAEQEVTRHVPGCAGAAVHVHPELVGDHGDHGRSAFSQEDDLASRS